MTRTTDSAAASMGRVWRETRPDDSSGHASLHARLLGWLPRHLDRSELKLPGTEPIVSFTFDDFLLSSVTTGARIVEEEGARASFFLNGGTIGGQTELGRVGTLEDLDRLYRAGHEIGSHGYAHIDAMAAPATAYQTDLTRNAAFLKCHLPDADIRSYAYPYGAAPLSAKRVARARHAACRGVHPGLNVGSVDRGLVRAFPLETVRFDPLALRDLLKEAVRRKAWLVFYLHDVSDDPTRFGVTPDHLRRSIRACLDAGCRVAPFGDVVAEALTAAAGCPVPERGAA